MDLITPFGTLCDCIWKIVCCGLKGSRLKIHCVWNSECNCCWWCFRLAFVMLWKHWSVFIWAHLHFGCGPQPLPLNYLLCMRIEHSQRRYIFHRVNFVVHKMQMEAPPVFFIMQESKLSDSHLWQTKAKIFIVLFQSVSFVRAEHPSCKGRQKTATTVYWGN